MEKQTARGLNRFVYPSLPDPEAGTHAYLNFRLPSEERLETGVPQLKRSPSTGSDNALNTFMELAQGTDPELAHLASEYANEIYGMTLPDLSDAIEEERTAIVQRLSDNQHLSEHMAHGLRMRLAQLDTFETTHITQNFITWHNTEDTGGVYAVDGVPLSVLKTMYEKHTADLHVSVVTIAGDAYVQSQQFADPKDLNAKALTRAKQKRKTFLPKAGGRPAQALVARTEAAIVDEHTADALRSVEATKHLTTIGRQIHKVSTLLRKTHVFTERQFQTQGDILHVALDTRASTIAPERRQVVADFIQTFATEEKLRMRLVVSPEGANNHLEIALPDKKLRISVSEWQHALTISDIDFPSIQNTAEETNKNLRKYFERIRIEGRDKPSIEKISTIVETQPELSRVSGNQDAAAFFSTLGELEKPEVVVFFNGIDITTIGLTGSNHKLDPYTFAQTLHLGLRQDPPVTLALTVGDTPLVHRAKTFLPAFQGWRINNKSVSVRVKNI